MSGQMPIAYMGGVEISETTLATLDLNLDLLSAAQRTIITIIKNKIKEQ